jgi:hypothetical protein
LTTVGLAAAGTIETSQTLTAEGRVAKSGTPATVETPTTVLVLEGAQTATVWSPITHEFSGTFTKNLSERIKVVKKS